MLQQPQPLPETHSETPSQNTQNARRHRIWLLLQCFFWIHNLFILCICLYLLSQFSLLDIQISAIPSTPHYAYALESIEHWQKGYIIDIKQVNTDNCPQGYIPLISHSWPGSMQGCYCRTVISNHASEYVLQGACSSELIGYGCVTVPAMGKEDMKMWKGGKLLCYKRVGALSFYNSTQGVVGDGVAMATCASGQKYQVNNLPQIPCPVSSISNTSLSSSTQTVLPLAPDASPPQNLYFDSSQNYPIADFKLTEYAFCPYFPDINISPNKNGNYILQYTNYSVSCTETDGRMVQFDYLTQQDYYTNNTRVYDKISGLPGFPRPSSSYNYRLGFIRYPAWTQECRVSQTHNLHQATYHLLLTHISEKSKLILYVGVPCFILLGILVRALYFIRRSFELKSKKQYGMLMRTDTQIGQQIPNLNIVKSLKRQIFFLILQLLLLIAPLAILCFSAYIFISQSTWLKQSFNLNCTEAHLNWIFRFYEDKIDNGNNIIGRCIMFCIVIMSVIVGNFAIRKKYGDLRVNSVKQEIQIGSNQGLIKEDIDEKKMGNGEEINLQDSSDIMLRKEKEELKVYDLDNFMSNQLQGGAGETGFNFYANQSIEQENLQIGKKKKKKGIKRRNLFKDAKNTDGPADGDII